MSEVQVPPHVIKFWKEEGRSEAEIAQLIKALQADYHSRLGKAAPKKPYLSDRTGEMLQLAQAGWTYSRIADRMGCSREWVSVLLRRSGYERREVFKQESRARYEQIVRLRKQGKTYAQIKQELHVSGETICIALNTKGAGQDRTKLPVGCDRCLENEYSRGLCRKCYARWQRAGCPDLPVVQPKKKSGPKT